jgi:type IV pilus assembly protein PilB
MRTINNGSNAAYLIDLLFRQNLLTQKQLDSAREKQSKLIGTQKSLQELLVEMGLIKEDDLIKVLAKAFNVPIFDIHKEKIDFSATKLIPEKAARRYGIIPVRKEGNTLILAMANPNDIVALDDIKTMTNMQVRPVLMKKSDISECIDKYYQLTDSLYDILKSMDNTRIEIQKDDELGRGVFSLKNNKYKSSVAVRLANFILSDAIKAKASDIHIEPQEHVIFVRYRIDGNLKNIMKLPKAIHTAMVVRIKILTKLNIVESKKPQDGRVRILINDRKVDLRISTMPTFHGEKIAIRLLDPKEAKIKLNQIGFQEEELNTFMEAITRTQGMILVTGPTGSGKTSTLYAALNFIKSETKNIITIEDPIEYLIEGISQMQIDPIKNITFANGLKNILRQDPNVILVGEIRDKKAAEIAFRASLTGHLVFSTLHTNNTASSITRLLDIGLEPYVISSSLMLIVSQRLIRLTCPYCKEKYIPNKKLLNQLSVYIDKSNVKEFFKGKGCRRCNTTGYLGRTAIFEMLKINEMIKSLITAKASESVIFKEAIKNGLKTLSESGVEKVAKGMTTLEEVVRCSDITEEIREKTNFNSNENCSQRTYSYGQNIFIFDGTDAIVDLNNLS